MARKGNKNYQKGARRERQLVNEARKKGLTSARSAGSHSVFDLYIIDFKNRKIIFMQVKDKKLYGKEKKQLADLSKLNDEYLVEFKKWSKEDLIDRRKKEFKDKPIKNQKGGEKYGKEEKKTDEVE